ncbi:very short patch repair endonuclease [Tardibacter chloracetimidivorans]|uniref:Very short patch repair endonuclease n=1 Tax=Tardibacter chloracetimidivorans TaxID=1921510 RepID=A0A1L3ZQI8_9SPHN|nr:very short patch repair endonuclease [Tardibacter chloracetimidivorans]
MADVVDKATRSRMMSGIQAKDTKPEIALRGALHRAGLRYRLHAASLPGKPDIVLPSRRAVVFVHGCFWHRHAGCHWCSTPASNAEFWTSKFERNMERDRQAMDALRKQGWRIAVVWECGLRAFGLAETAAEVIAWVRSGSGDFESDLVRTRDD